MKYISETIANKIGALALNFTEESDFQNLYSVSVGGTTLCKNFSHNDLLCSIFFMSKKYKEIGHHLNVMKNGDIFARNSPYYDGQLELIAVYNQRKIFELVESA